MLFKKFWAGALFIALAVALAVWWGQQGTQPEPQYRTAPVQRGRMESAVTSSGVVNPVRQVQVGTQVSGQIVQLLADFNTEVKQGQLIARIDPENFDNKVRQSQADLEAAKAAVLNAQASVTAAIASVARAQLEADNAQRDLGRKKDLLAQAFISQADFDATRNVAGTFLQALNAAKAQADVARAQVQSAQATVKQREAALAQSRVDRERTEIRSPVDGVVIKRSVDVGQTVASSLQAPELFIIARDLSDMQVEVAIDEADIGRVKIGQPATFTVDAFPGRVYHGKVTQVRKAAISLQNVITYTAVVAFSNAGEQLLPGMTANARILTETREDVLKLPNAALRLRLPGFADSPNAAAGPSASASLPGGASAPSGYSMRPAHTGRVFVLSGDGKPQPVPVTLGMSDGVLTEVVSNQLKDGTQVITGVILAPALRSGGPKMSF